MEIECRTCKDPDLVFVFGSNLAGRHGAGAAAHASKFHEAYWGTGIGVNSLIKKPSSYAIPTKDSDLVSLPIRSIKASVKVFLDYATSQPSLTFDITRIGCGLAGYTDKDIAPMFANAPENCLLPEEWKKILDKETEV